MLYAMKAFHGFRRNYFSGRKQSVHIDFLSTEEFAITSIIWSASGGLGIQLFMVYINDLPRSVKHGSVMFCSAFL